MAYIIRNLTYISSGSLIKYLSTPNNNDNKTSGVCSTKVFSDEMSTFLNNANS